METPNLQHKLAAQAHELGLPCVICELHFVKFTLCIYPFHVCKYNVISHVCMYISWKIKFGLIFIAIETSGVISAEVTLFLFEHGKRIGELPY